jgi:glutamine---fructose-6-phosphate transaminase (isomerizing)
MCGIFGATGESGSSAVKAFENLALVSQRRGLDSFGLYASTVKSDFITCFKAQSSAKSNFKSLGYKEFKCNLQNSSDNCVLIGHTRLATNGDSANQNNNQPAYLGKWIVVHNGIITNESFVKEKFRDNFSESHELDTYALLGLLESISFENSLFNISSMFRKIDSEIQGANNFAFMNISLKKVFLYSSNGSLFICKSNNQVIFASEKSFLISLEANLDVRSIQLHKGFGAVIDIEKNDFDLFNYNDELNDTELQVSNLVGSIRDLSDYPRTINATNLDLSFGGRMLAEYEKVLFDLRQITRCKKCLLPISFPGIVIDHESCSVCKSYRLNRLAAGPADLTEKLNLSKDQPVLVSLSGGRDSCFALHHIRKELGIKAVAFTYDWGMVTDLARRNQSRLCGQLGVEHIVVSADISRKRQNIRNNIIAWLKRPSLGTVPLFMAGDKHYFYYAEKVRRELGLNNLIMGENQLEKTGFKTKFAGAEQAGDKNSMAYGLSNSGKLKMLSHYGKEFLLNTGYWNSSLLDTFTGFLSYYALPHDYLNIFEFLSWNEETVNSALSLYQWEYSPDCQTSWRIGDGTAPFYNYIYYVVAGFSENDTLRANQLREGHISLNEARYLCERDNAPRVESFSWYCRALKLDPGNIVRNINKIPKHYIKYI